MKAALALCCASVFAISCKEAGESPKPPPPTAPTADQAPRPARPHSPENVIVIVVDTLRADHLGFAGYSTRPTSPNLDELARYAFVFENAYASAPWTRASLASLFTSKHPMEHLVLSEAQDADNRLDERFQTMAELFADQAYRTAGFFTNPHYAFGLEQGFRDRHQRFGLVASNLFQEAGAWLRAHLAQEIRQPYFLLVHTIDPHDGYLHHAAFPWAPENSPLRLVKNLFPAELGGEGFGASCDNMQRARDLDPAELAEMVACYDQEIAFTDNELGHFLSLLKETGQLERSIVIVTADHGEEFRDHGGYWHGCTLHEELVRVPLVVWVPWMKGRRIREPVALVDLFPTLVDLLVPDARSKLSLSGSSLVPLLDGKPHAAKPIFIATEFRRPLGYGVIAEGHKLVTGARGDEALYALEDDPGEQTNLLAGPLSPTQSALLARLRSHLASLDNPGWRARAQKSTGTGTADRK